MSEQIFEKKVSRRGLMAGIGAFAAGAAIAKLGGFVSNAEAKGK